MDKEKFDPNVLGEKIIKTIKTIFDPEIPVDIYELGLIYDIMINEDFDVKIMMTLTTPNCPVAEPLPVDVEEKVKTVEIHWPGGDKKETFKDLDSNFYYKVLEGTSISIAQGKY